jgi:PKD repeat protein
MRISACPLLLAVIALVSNVPATAGATTRTRVSQRPLSEVTSVSRAQKKDLPITQSPQTVNVRPRVATPQPGIPAVKATADRRRVPLGDLVTFTLSPASVIFDSHFTVTIFFGDGQQQRIRKPQIDHFYTTAGTFTYSILVKPSEQSVSPQLPTVKLSVTPTSVKPDSLVNFKAELSHDYPNIRYRFVFADRSQTDWQASPLTTHSYRSPGTYSAYVDIGLGNGGSFKQVGGSARRAIEVSTPRSRLLAVQLTADRANVQAKDAVTFRAQVDPSEPNLRYRFNFGDRSRSTEWQTSAQTKHVYASSGSYPASVDVRVMNSRSGQQNASSKPLSIKVEPEQSASSTSIDLFVAPRSVVAGFPVYLRATADSANSQTRYRFNFGDGSPPSAWKETREELHIYSMAGNYPAFVEISRSSNEPNAVAASPRKQIKVTPLITGPTGSPTPTPQPSPTATASQSNSPGSSPTPNGSATPLGSPNGSPTVPATTTPTPDGGSTPFAGGTNSPSTGATPAPSATASPALPADSGLSDNWWKYVLVAALILFGCYQGWKYFFAPTPTLEPHVDPGVAALGTEGGPLAINFQMELDPDVTDGQFTVDTTEGSLIKSERKSNG